MLGLFSWPPKSIHPPLLATAIFAPPQICSILRTAIARGVSSVHPDSPVASENPSRQVSRSESQGVPTPGLNRVPVDAGGAAGVTTATTDELFTDQELMEDSRAIDFSIGRSFSGPGAGAGSCLGETCSGVRKAGYSVGGVFDDTSASAVLPSSRSMALASKKRGNYYDWFLSKLEGKEAGIIRGYVDARGKSLVRPNGGVHRAGSDARPDGSVGTGAGARENRDILADASLKELLDLAGDMIEELDVPDDHLSKDRHTQGDTR